MNEDNLIQLSAEALRKLRADSLTASQYRLLFYLLEIAQSGEWVDLHSSTIADELGVSAKTVSRALSRLEDVGIFDLELITAHWQIKLKKQGQKCPTEGQKCPTEGQKCPTEGQKCPTEGQKCPTEGQKCPTEGQKCPTEGQKCPTEGQKCPTEGQKCPTEGQKCPTEGQKCPTEGQKCPTEGQKCPTEGQKCPTEGQKCPADQRKIKGFSDFPQKGTSAKQEREISLYLKNQEISLSESDVLQFIAARNPQAKTRAYIRACWKNDREYWLEQYRQWLENEQDVAPQISQGGSPASHPIASLDFVQQQFTALCTAAAAAGDRMRLETLIDQLQRDYPDLYGGLIADHPEWFAEGGKDES